MQATALSQLLVVHLFLLEQTDGRCGSLRVSLPQCADIFLIGLFLCDQELLLREDLALQLFILALDLGLVLLHVSVRPLQTLLDAFE